MVKRTPAADARSRIVRSIELLLWNILKSLQQEVVELRH